MPRQAGVLVNSCVLVYARVHAVCSQARARTQHHACTGTLRNTNRPSGKRASIVPEVVLRTSILSHTARVARSRQNSLPAKAGTQSARTARQHKTGEIQTITFVRTFAAFPVVVEDGLKHALELSFRHQPVVIFIQPNEVFVNPCCRGGVILVRMVGPVPGQSHRVTQRGNETRKKGKGKDGLGSGGEHCERDR